MNVDIWSGGMIRYFYVLCLIPAIAHALYFHIGETEKKCFIQDIPDDTMVVGKFARHLIAKCVIPVTVRLSLDLRPVSKWKVRMGYDSSCYLIALRDANPKRTNKPHFLTIELVYTEIILTAKLHQLTKRTAK